MQRPWRKFQAVGPCQRAVVDKRAGKRLRFAQRDGEGGVLAGEQRASIPDSVRVIRVAEA